MKVQKILTNLENDYFSTVNFNGVNIWLLFIWEMFKFNLGEKGSTYVMGVPKRMM